MLLWESSPILDVVNNMAKIKVNNLNKTGLDLFDDSESYLNELTESEINLMGGFYWTYYIRKIPPIRPPKIWV